MGDPDPYLDACSLAQNGASDHTVEMLGKNIGDLLNAKNISWGWFQGGFDLTLNNTGVNNYPNTTLGGTYYTGSMGTPKGGGLAGCVRQSTSSILAAAASVLQRITFSIMRRSSIMLRRAIPTTTGPLR